ncbi:hypothetical protein GP486_006046 [Trichoglossum hirsutum]|uniref:Nephrocystin 3-like N-terminal domain-containing protein n=1 Tax=Trichoglossum hirsutum TaxID=265104 RepID=A0A9P8L840_9PEZI|nr:hypothetical protein GP486_006046 [Trichoglossum hirsutum]
MAGIGEVASIITVIQISTQVLSWCQEYIANVKGATTDVRRLGDGVNDLIGVLKRIEGLDLAQLSNLSWLSEPGGQLERCKGHLDELAAKLYQGDGKGQMRRVGLRALKWHFTSKEVEKYVKIIDGHKTMLTLALTADQTDHTKQNSKSLISSLITQLCCRRPDIPKILKDLYQTCQNGHQNPSVKELKAVLSAILGSFESIYIILDALDECPLGGGERERLLTAIHEIHDWSNKRIHMLVTSRVEIDIKHELEYLLTEPPICIDSALVDEDIGVHVRSQLNTSRFSKWPASIKQEVELALTAQANGM